MRRPDHSPDEPLLFDLPLGQPDEHLEVPEVPETREKLEKLAKAEKRAATLERGGSRDKATPRPLASGPRPAPFSPVPLPAAEPAPAGVPGRPAGASANAGALGRSAGAPATAGTPGRSLARPGRRLAAGGADLMIHAALVVGVFFGCRGLGLQLELADWPPVLLFVLTFSFFYSVVPLAFWGHTLGMAWAGLVALNRDGEPLTFDQTARRWLGGLLTLALAGLPLLTALRGRTLADLLSGSETRAGHGAV